jgi:hypothetical protein
MKPCGSRSGPKGMGPCWGHCTGRRASRGNRMGDSQVQRAVADRAIFLCNLGTPGNHGCRIRR